LGGDGTATRPDDECHDKRKTETLRRHADVRHAHTTMDVIERFRSS
jgi:hypothetical protein